MKKFSILTIAFFLFAVSPNTTAQSQDRKKCESAKSVLHLLPGYKVDVFWGIDSWSAKISKEGSITIELFQGLHVGVDADAVDKKDVAWREEQVVNGQQVICVYTKSNDLVVSIPQLAVNFRGHTRNQQDLTEMLLMVLTYEPTHGYPVEPGTVTTPCPDDPR
jgi:hypothetical protein